LAAGLSDCAAARPREVGFYWMEIEIPRLVVVEEHEILRDGLCTLFKDANCANVVGTASDGYTAIKLCRTAMPDILVMDMDIARPNGPETFKKVRSVDPNIKIILYSSEDNQFEAFSMLSNGAMGFLPKRAKGLDFVNAVQSAHLGYVSMPRTYMQDFTSIRQKSNRTGNIYGLSPREVEVLEACVCGIKTNEVARRMNISVRTVETHRNSIYRKTSCHSIGELSRIARQLE